MKKLLRRIYNTGPARFSKIEFWVATAGFVIAVLSLISDDAVVIVVNGKSIFQFPPFISGTLRLTAIYISFIGMNFFVVPGLIRRENIILNIAVAATCFFIIALSFGTVDFGFIPLTLFGIYTAIRYAGIFIWKRSGVIHAKYKYISPGVLIAAIVWLVSILFFIAGNAESEMIAIWAVMIPLGIIIYAASFYALIPSALKRKRPFLSYLVRVSIILLLSTLPMAMIIYAVTGDEDAPVIITVASYFFQLALTVPFSWMLFKRYNKGRQEVISLQKELGQSVASFDFLRSQINPHFLFNALNTLYGTAINEKAERTAEGVQKLGDMMRFMLDENMMDMIPLSREIEYLKNYIALQKLRTDPSPTVRVETAIVDVAVGSIAPMLLIPFVENAFKHGISFREPSHIRVTLEARNGQLFFDVYNSKHPKPANDPEAGRNGIGLANVRQRLELLYPTKHELIIRETATEFFVHLTIQLSLLSTKV